MTRDAIVTAVDRRLAQYIEVAGPDPVAREVFLIAAQEWAEEDVSITAGDAARTLDNRLEDCLVGLLGGRLQ